MNSHALSVLEFPRVLDVVAGFATSDLGADARPRARPDDRSAHARPRARARRRHARSASGRRARGVPTRFPISPARSRVCVSSAASGTGSSSLAAATLLRSSRRTQTSLRDPQRPAIVRAVLAPLLDALISAPALEARIERTILEDGTVKDDASAALRRIRRELRSAQGELDSHSRTRDGAARAASSRRPTCRSRCAMADT